MCNDTGLCEELINYTITNNRKSSHVNHTRYITLFVTYISQYYLSNNCDKNLKNSNLSYALICTLWNISSSYYYYYINNKKSSSTVYNIIIIVYLHKCNVNVPTGYKVTQIFRVNVLEFKGIRSISRYIA